MKRSLGALVGIAQGLLSDEYLSDQEIHFLNDWLTTNDAILAATNLGDDADTTAAICGQLAGAYYGENGIPDTWLKRLAMVGEIGAIAERLLARSMKYSDG